MPTGYTSKIKDGITFEEFACQCARAFGALASMREENKGDKPLPDKIEPSTYYQESIKSKTKEIDAINALTDDECNARAKQAHEDEIERYNKHIEDNAALMTSYVSMLRRVYEWTPPTKDHQGLKDFMVKQIGYSMDFDSMGDYYTKAIRDARIMTGAEWKAQQLYSLSESLSRAEEENQKEIERAAENTEWIRQLKNSLAS